MIKPTVRISVLDITAAFATVKHMKVFFTEFVGMLKILP
jgi:hypothetical protein